MTQKEQIVADLKEKLMAAPIGDLCLLDLEALEFFLEEKVLDDFSLGCENE